MSTEPEKNECEQDVAENKCESLVLRSRKGFPMIPMAHQYLRSELPRKPYQGIVVTRRRFLGTAAVATAGLLLIKPLGIEGASGFFSNLLGFFKKFAKGILLNALNQSTNLTGPFGAILSGAQNILTGYTPQGGVFGDEGENPLGRYLLGMGKVDDLNAAGVVTNEGRNLVRGIFQGPSLIGLGSMVVTPAVKALLRTKKGQKGLSFVQKYLLPNVVNNTNPIALKAGETMLAPNQPFTRSYGLPQFYQSDSGAMTLINYLADSAQNRVSGAIRGRGESIIYTVPPEKVSLINQFIAQHPNFWSDPDARKELIDGLRGLAENPLKNYPFEFESAD